MAHSSLLLSLSPVEHDARSTGRSKPFSVLVRKTPRAQKDFQFRTVFDQHGRGIQDHAGLPGVIRHCLQNGLATVKALG